MRQRLLAGLMCIALATSALSAHTASAAQNAPQPAPGLRISTDFGAMVRVNSVARLLAGMPPTHPAHFQVAETSAWKEHSSAMRTAWNQVGSTRVNTMTAWRDSAINSTCPAGKTLLYPFSGPDFFNAYWLFPDCENYVLFGLEHVGEVPDVDNLHERDVGRLLADVRQAVADLIDRNYFITENMTRQLRTAQLRGVVPLLIIPMAMSDLEILRIYPHDLPMQVRMRSTSNLKSIDKPTRGPMRQINGITIEFRKNGSSNIQRLNYFTLDATDRGLEHYPEFLTYLNSLAPTNTLLKAASYLLHGREFRRLRTTLLSVSSFLIQDDTGVPFSMLPAKQWDVHLYGRYETPIRPFERAFQPALDKAYRTAQPAPLPFEFGYSFSDKRDNRSNVLVGRKNTLTMTEAPALRRVSAGSTDLTKK